MKTTDLLLAIEALGYSEESRTINTHKTTLFEIMRDTFYRSPFEESEFVGSISEGVAITQIHECAVNDFKIETDNDFVLNLTDFELKGYATSDMSSPSVIEKMNAEKDLAIIPCQDAPGYVYLKLHKPIMGNHFLPNIDFSKKKEQVHSEARVVAREKNGPAVTVYEQLGRYPIISKCDFVKCLKYRSWPIKAIKWASRNKPNNWPSKKLIKKIVSMGINLAPIGHCDSDINTKELQWRIGIRGERELVLNLNETQMLCYIALRLILKGDIQLIHKDALSSYQMKHVIFWCVEQKSCQWTKENFEICLKTCINRLVEYITAEHFPHYFIEDRNLINRNTVELKERTLKALKKYTEDILTILSLRVFDTLKKTTGNLKVELFEWAKQVSIIQSCIRFYVEPFMVFIEDINLLWQSFEGHNTAVNLQNAKQILSILENRKMHFILNHIAYAENMVGLLYYSRYKETHLQNYKVKARELLGRSLTFENVSLKFRVATFYFSENEFDDCLGVCDAFLSNPCKLKTIDEKLQHFNMVVMNIIDYVNITLDDLTKVTEFKKKILAIFYDKCISEKRMDKRLLQQAEKVLSQIIYTQKERGDLNKWASCSENFIGTSHDALLLVFENLANLVFRDMNFNITFLASEKWAVPEVFQYELLSVKEYYPESYLYGIYIDPMLTCLVLSFLCYQKTNNLTKRDEMLRKMVNYIDTYTNKNGQTIPADLPHSLPLYRVYNIGAYCCCRAGRYQQASSYIMNSFKLYENANNAAYGYIRCICFTLKNIKIITLTAIALP